ncbi:hypothetical protein AWB78_08033 [Caballeronia calidae]|uniref:Uncharacterized protein n=1 Tax=Caballeronia calidae TaxID=1777139 RepID=A0A158EIY9_9BURK|nr:hypothetical protein [Caballeronia calidae]SAL06366.1 hypothetical protein AWB78_08033 [Caballeronia calidae]
MFGNIILIRYFGAQGVLLATGVGADASVSANKLQNDQIFVLKEFRQLFVEPIWTNDRRLCSWFPVKVT